MSGIEGNRAQIVSSPVKPAVNTQLPMSTMSVATTSLTTKQVKPQASVSSRILFKTAIHHTCGCRDNPHQPMAPRRRGSRVPSLRSALMQPTLYESTFFCLWQLGSFLFGMPGVRVVPSWSVFAPPLTRSAIVRWQEATDPQSPEGGSQRACHTEGAHSTASGRFSTVALFKQSYPALAVRKLSLWVASPGDMSEPPFSDRSLGRRPSVTLFQRGTACFRLKARRSNSEIDLCSNRFELCDVRNTSAHRKRLTTGEDVSGRELVGQIPQVKILGDLSARRQCAKQAQGSQCHTERATQR